jgi:hypothetical protein
MCFGPQPSILDHREVGVIKPQGVVQRVKRVIADIYYSAVRGDSGDIVVKRFKLHL